MGWAPGLPEGGFQFGYIVADGEVTRFEPYVGSLSFPTYEAAMAHARKTGWLR